MSRTSAPLRSWACPGVRRKPVGLPNASTVAWILVLRPPRLRPRVCLSGSPFCTSAVLVGAHDGGINHGVFVVRVLCQGFKHPLPDTGLAPARVTGVHDAKVAETGRQIPPRNTCTVAVQHGVHEQSIVFCSGSGLACLACKQVTDALPLEVKQCVSFDHRTKMALALRLSTLGALIDDTP